MRYRSIADAEEAIAEAKAAIRQQRAEIERQHRFIAEAREFIDLQKQRAEREARRARAAGFARLRAEGKPVAAISAATGYSVPTVRKRLDEADRLIGNVCSVEAEYAIL